MNIDHVSGSVESNRLAKSVSVEKSRQSTPKQKEIKTVSDTVDTSKLAQMMSQNSQDLSKVHNPRPEVVARLKEGMDDSADLSDTVIDSILRKMVD